MLHIVGILEDYGSFFCPLAFENYCYKKVFHRNKLPVVTYTFSAQIYKSHFCPTYILLKLDLCMTLLNVQRTQVYYTWVEYRFQYSREV